jgi:hypothetical protein
MGKERDRGDIAHYCFEMRALYSTEWLLPWQIHMQCNCQSGGAAETSENKQLVFCVVNEFIGLLVQSLGG